MIVIRTLCKVLTALCMIIVLAIMLLMVSEVFSRALFGQAILGSVEWAMVLLACSMSAFAASVLSNRQIKVNIFTSKLSAKKKVILEIIILTLTAITVGILSWRQFIYAGIVFDGNVEYQNIYLPQWPFVGVFAASYGTATLAVVLLIIRKVKSAIKGNWEQEAKLEETDEGFIVFADAEIRERLEKRKNMQGGNVK